MFSLSLIHPLIRPANFFRIPNHHELSFLNPDNALAIFHDSVHAVGNDEYGGAAVDHLADALLDLLSEEHVVNAEYLIEDEDVRRVAHGRDGKELITYSLRLDASSYAILNFIVTFSTSIAFCQKSLYKPYFTLHHIVHLSHPNL